MSSVTPEALQKSLEDLVGQDCILQSVLDGRTLPTSAADVLASGSSGLGYSQLNELLLLLGFDRVTHAFFQFLIDGTTQYQDGAAIASFKQLEDGVARFRSLGLLMFGNVKYAFKVLSRDAELLDSRISRLKPIDAAHFEARHDPITPIKPIPPDQTYYLGYVIERELQERLKNPDDLEAARQEAERISTVEVGKLNHEAYLTSDHLDVYVATSMRRRHEFLAVNRLGKEIFAHPELEKLKLRWFDPTQAYCKDRIDKGLSEALMLRRAKCTIYLAQETDTLGKDSELASTLAQGKPVIAYVPEVQPDFAERLLSELEEAYPDTPFGTLVMEQLQLIEPTAAWTDSEIRQWVENPTAVDSARAMSRLQQALEKHYNGRAQTLMDTHPLGVQVNLATGVANGVLVVRTVGACASLVRRILTNTLELRVTKEHGAAVLREAISGCVFRIATADVMLTNAFWNFYLDPSE